MTIRELARTRLKNAIGREPSQEAVENLAKQLAQQLNDHAPTPQVPAAQTVQEEKTDYPAAWDDRETSTNPDESLIPPGIVGDVARCILEHSGIPQPKFAVAAALTVCGALVGRGVRDYSGQRTNLFALAVAPSSSGKDAPATFCAKLLQDLGRDKLLAARVTSDSALEILLDDFPVRFMLLDEVGDYLGSLKTSGPSNPFLQTVIPVLKELWSRGDSVYVGKTRARDTNGKWKPPARIDQPCVCIYGTGAPSRLFETMTERDLDDGSIPRFLCFIETTIQRRRDVPALEIPEELKRRILDALDRLGIKPHGSTRQTPEGGKIDDVPDPLTVDYTDEARRAIEAFEDFKYDQIIRAERDPYLYLWGKAVENARRVALTVAVFRNPSKPVVDEADVAYAINLVKTCVVDMIAHCRDHVAGTRQERESKTVLRIVKRAGDRGIPLSELTMKTRSLSRLARREYLDDLVDAGIVEEVFREGTGRKLVAWYRMKQQ